MIQGGDVLRIIFSAVAIEESDEEGIIMFTVLNKQIIAPDVKRLDIQAEAIARAHMQQALDSRIGLYREQRRTGGPRPAR